MLRNYILHKGSNHLASSQDKLLHAPFTCMENHCSIIAYISQEEKRIYVTKKTNGERIETSPNLEL